MAEFKLTEVAKRAGISMDDALQKLRDAGQEVTGTDATVSVDQMKLLGVDPQQMIDRRKERLQQALERRSRGSLGKEIVMNERRKEEAAATPGRKISKEELQKRKSELNKDVQKVDEARQNMQRLKESEAQVPQQQPETAPPVTDDEMNKETVIEEKPALVAETPPVEVKQPEVPPVEKTEPAPEQPEKAAPAPQQERKPTPRPLGPAGYVPREPRTDRRPSGDQRSGQSYQRPSGPTSGRPTGPASGRPTGPRAGSDDRRSTGTGPQRGGPQRPGQQRPGYGTSSQSESPSLSMEEQRRRDITRKPKEGDATPAKEEAKKPKVKSDLKAKDWNKTITEGMGELDIEKEIESGATEVAPEAETPVKPTAPRNTYSGRQDRRTKRRQDRETPPPTPKPTHITIGEQVVVSELAGMIGIKAAELVKKLFNMGIIATVNQAIDAETAELLCLDYGVEVTKKVITEDDLMPVYEDNPEDLERRPPVVTVMGHVDHGKTSLLDAIRSTSVAEKEAGGITQHIGAYEVDLNGRKITFLDTPGHEAFTSLRARGAQATDIVILVVAANDGVMPQTKEAIDHAKAAGVRIVVAVNKIDRPDANPDRVRQQLAEYGIISDEWGGDYQFQEISAKNRMGIEDLLERVLLEADILELKGNPNRPAEGIVIESQLDKQKGPVATILVRNGTLHRGDTFIVGSQMGKVRAMYNYRGTGVKDAPISMPVEVMGFSTVPEAGDKMMVMEDEKAARNIVELRARQQQHLRHTSGGAISLSDFFDKVKEGEVQELNIIIKSDVQGSLEALKSSLTKLTNAEVKVNIVHDATGGINESDVVLAMASKAIIIGFNVRPDNNARTLADREGVSIELYSIIYKAIEDVKLALEGMLTPDTREQVTGRVEVRQVFSVPKLGKIAGCYVLEGKVTRNSLVRVIRDNVVVYDGKIGSLKRFTDDVREVTHGYECGLSIDRYQDIKEGDILEVYEMVEEKRTLDDVKPSGQQAE